MSTSLQSVSEDGITPKDMAVAFRNGCEAVSFCPGRVSNAMSPATAAMLAGDGADIPASAAQKGADATAAMTNAEAGRSNYLSEEVLMGTPDPGLLMLPWFSEH